jgi:Xaa-Pro aminopeptidase
MKNAKSGMYEYQLEAYYDLAIKQDGNKPVSFKTIAASGINATTLHYSTNNSIINDGDLILFDLGCKDEGYCSDITRTFPVNGKFTPLQRKIYNIVLKANKEVLKKAKAGMTLKDLQEICIDVLAEGCLKAKLIKEKEEIKKYYFHGVSHSIGLDTHDPFLRSQPLPVNAVISNEPGLYFKEYNIGIRIEDDILIKENKAINLSKSIIKGVAQIERFMKQ